MGLPIRPNPVDPSARPGHRLLAAGMALSLLAVPEATVPIPGGSAPCRQTAGWARQTPSLPPGLGEVSGLVTSQQYPGWSWMIRDSGNPASLYALRFQDDGTPLVREIRVAGATNVDWEDLVYRWGDPQSRLFVIESGQSGGNRFIYELPEPDPEGPSEVSFFTRYEYAYPNQANYNTESAFWFAGRLVLVTKTAPGRVYRFEDPLSTTGVNQPAYVGDLAGADRVSVARVSWDWRTIVAADHERLVVYRAPGVTRDLAALIARWSVRCEHFAPGDNVEAGDFRPVGQLGLTLIAESRSVYQTPAEL